MDSVTSILFAFSSALLTPVVIALLLLVVWCLLQSGGVVREALDRRRAAKFRRLAMADLAKDSGACFFRGVTYPGLLGLFARKGQPLRSSALHLDKLVSDLEVEASGRLVHLNLAIRIGPILGLMGTLIPMGPSLIALTSGDLDAMAADLVVAFSTTVLGLLIGGVCLGLSHLRRRWYAQDLCDMEYVYQCLHTREVAA